MTDKQIVREITAVLAAQLKNHAQIQINTLGTFRVAHQNQELHQDKDGRIVMKAPADRIVFSPENQEPHETES